MPHALDGVELKLQAAHEQILAFNSEIVAFLDKPAWDIIQIPLEDLNKIYNLLIEREKVPPMWSIRIGEIAHNIHSALDHLVCQLVIRESGEAEVTSGNQYPIYPTEELYDKNVARRLKGVGASAEPIIRASQPYLTGGVRSPLLHLYELSIKDKHHEIIPAVVAMHPDNPNQLGVTVDAEGDWKMFLNELPPFAVNEMQISHVTVPPTQTPLRERMAKLNVSPQILFGVALKSPTCVERIPPQQVLKNCWGLANQIVQVIKREIF